MRRIVSNQLRQLMEQKQKKEGRRISQRLVAHETGLDKTTIDRYARNEVQVFDGRVVATLCEYFECGIEDFLVFEEVQDNEAPELKNPEALIA